MESWHRSNTLVRSWLTGLLASLFWARTGAAAEPVAVSDDAELHRRGVDTTQPIPGASWFDFARARRDLAWSRVALADDLGSVPVSGARPTEASAWLALIRMPDDGLQAVPRMGTSLAAAVASLMGGGLPVFKVWRGGQLRQRHCIRPFFRSRGVTLTWRIEW